MSLLEDESLKWDVTVTGGKNGRVYSEGTGPVVRVDLNKEEFGVSLPLNINQIISSFGSELSNQCAQQESDKIARRNR